MSKYNRRRFLKTGCQAISTAGLALGANPMMTLAHAQDTGDDYKALVCVYLKGGSDCFSLFVPTDNSGYQAYANSRQGLTVSQSRLLAMSSANSGAQMGIHSSAPGLHSLFNNGDLAMISNVGNLVEPTTLAQYNDQSVILPAQLFSHSDQEIQWQQLQGRGRATEGWGAIATDYLNPLNARDYLTSISLAGSNYWQTGYDSSSFNIRSSGVVKYSGMDKSKDWEVRRSEAFDRVAQMPQAHIHAQAFADIQNRARTATEELGAVLEQQNAISTAEPEPDTLSAKLRMVANLIAARTQLGMRRQIFYVTLNGFDTHDNQNSEHADLFAELSAGLSSFQSALEDLGMTDSVTTFTASDFGRTLTSNGDGTDHGWGNHMMVMGGAVNGADIYGDIPSMAVDGPDSVRNGRMLPKISSSQYAATLLRWTGLTETQINNVLPNLQNFAVKDLNFLS